MGVSYHSDDEMEDLTKMSQQSAFSSSSITGVPSGATNSSTVQQASSTNSQQPHVKAQTCCLIDEGKKCSRFAGNASYSKRIQKNVFYKKLRLEFDQQVCC